MRDLPDGLIVISAPLTVLADQAWLLLLSILAVVGQNGSEFVFVLGLRESSVHLDNLPKASSVGAKTVNGPSPLRVSTRPAALAAATVSSNFRHRLQCRRCLFGCSRKNGCEHE